MTDRIGAAIALNRQRRIEEARDGRRNGSTWLVECRDMWDRFDDDAGVYFVECADEEAVDETIRHKTPDSEFDRVLGIYDLRRPIDEQGPGLTRAQWLAGQRTR